MNEDRKTPVVKVLEDSMEPTIPRGAITILSHDLEIEDGKVVVVRLFDGSWLLRRCYDLGESYRLVADNPAYPDVVVQKTEIEEIARANYSMINLVETEG